MLHVLQCLRRSASPPPLLTGSRGGTPQLEEGDTIYEFLVAPGSGAWQHWRENVPLWRYPVGEERPKFAQLVIPTLDSVRYEHLMSLVHSVGKVRVQHCFPMIFQLSRFDAKIIEIYHVGDVPPRLCLSIPFILQFFSQVGRKCL